jgi:hypothetical protein
MVNECLYFLNADLQSWLSSVSRKLKLIFDSNHQDTTAGTIDLDVVAVNTDKDYMQVSHIMSWQVSHIVSFLFHLLV